MNKELRKQTDTVEKLRAKVIRQQSHISKLLMKANRFVMCSTHLDLRQIQCNSVINGLNMHLQTSLLQKMNTELTLNTSIDDAIQPYINGNNVKLINDCATQMAQIKLENDKIDASLTLNYELLTGLKRDYAHLDRDRNETLTGLNLVLCQYNVNDNIDVLNERIAQTHLRLSILQEDIEKIQNIDKQTY